MTGSEYIRLLAMLPLGREEPRVAVIVPCFGSTMSNGTRFSQIAAEHHATIRAFKSGYKNH
jgi:hypothetical protein